MHDTKKPFDWVEFDIPNIDRFIKTAIRNLKPFHCAGSQFTGVFC